MRRGRKSFGICATFFTKMFLPVPEEEGAVCLAAYREVLLDRTEVPIQDELAFRSKEQHQYSSHKEADPGSQGAFEELLLADDIMNNAGRRVDVTGNAQRRWRRGERRPGVGTCIPAQEEEEGGTAAANVCQAWTGAPHLQTLTTRRCLYHYRLR
ncbi:Hypothetical predicted protein [Pelobates cultripes]|uniref:Uncharacterized protein n=1 Tax=Pelobates cultripes TaxID=61616 RepID=A0AAD1RNM3_PELCU|nr:Hypothetical predicted protein [Pelobates cultripes]